MQAAGDGPRNRQELAKLTKKVFSRFNPNGEKPLKKLL
jgi:hypothetical protein